jgi:hypothetical protein
MEQRLKSPHEEIFSRQLPGLKVLNPEQALTSHGSGGNGGGDGVHGRGGVHGAEQSQTH